MRPATVGELFCSITVGRLIIWHKITNTTGDRMANDSVQCYAFDIGCAGTDTALWQLFCRAGLCFLFFKISALGNVQPKVVNRLESNNQQIFI